MLSDQELRTFAARQPIVREVNLNDLPSIEKALDKSPPKCDPALIAAYAKLLPAYLRETRDPQKLATRFDRCPRALRQKIRRRFEDAIRLINDPHELTTLYKKVHLELRPLIEIRFAALLRTTLDITIVTGLYLVCPDEMDHVVVSQFSALVPNFLHTFSTTDEMELWYDRLPEDLRAMVMIAIDEMNPK